MDGSITVLLAGDDTDAAPVREAAADRPHEYEVRSVDAEREGLLTFERDVDCVVATGSLRQGDAMGLFEGVRRRAPDTPCLLWHDADTPLEAPTGPAGPLVDTVRRDAPVERLFEAVERGVLDRAQSPYPVAEGERERLVAVAASRESVAAVTPALDRLTSLAKRHFKVPVAFVGLVGRREEQLVACAGANWDRFDRSNTVCTYTVLDADVTAVRDTRLDARFADNDTLQSMGIRAYAGAPLLVDGARVGAFCLADGRPRSFSAVEREDLRLFAEDAAEAVDHHRTGAADTPVDATDRFPTVEVEERD